MRFDTCAAVRAASMTWAERVYCILDLTRHPREVQASENDNGMPLSVLNKPYQASTSTSRLEGEETTAGGPGTVIRK